MKGPITLSDDPENYTRLSLQFITNDSDRFSMDVWSPETGMRFVASMAKWQGNGGFVWVKSRTYEINGRTIDTAQDAGNYHCGEICVNNGESDAGNTMKIVRVVGWR